MNWIGVDFITLSVLQVEPIKVKSDGLVDIDYLKQQLEKHSKNISCLMITYPSTYGVFEETIGEVCRLIHLHGGQVNILV